MLFPVLGGLVLLLGYGFHFLTEGCLTVEVFLLFGSYLLEVLLVTLVDYCRSGFEAAPYLLTQLLGNGSDFAVLLMQFLQLIECADDIFFLGELLGSFAKLRLQFEILLEVILACFAVELQQVVELLYIELITAPQFRRLLCRYGLDVLPLLLQFLEFVV